MTIQFEEKPFEATTLPEETWRYLVSIADTWKISDIFFNRTGIYARIAGDVVPVAENMEAKQYRSVIQHIMPATEFDHSSLEPSGQLQDKGSVDFAFAISGTRFRGNVFKDINGISGACRPLPKKSFTAAEIGLNPQLMEMAGNASRGLYLVTGPTGSGKSSTLCTMLEYINATYYRNIVTIEDPIEFVFKPNRCIISQREVGSHTGSFSDALRASMRQAPNVIFVGEMRDAETVVAAIQAAQTGHVVFSTLHTQRVFATITRIIDLVPESMKSEVRTSLSNCLNMIIGQRLLPRARGGGVVAAREVYVNVPAGAVKIRGGKEKTISDIMISGAAAGMAEWESVLKGLLAKGIISEETAYANLDGVE